MLILASASPRRAELLRAAGIGFTVRPAHIDESLLPGEAPERYVRRLAEAKARATPAGDGDIVLAADTTVHVAGEILEKPKDRADAVRMLALLAGRAHDVLTGICLRQGARCMVEAETTRVHFLPMTVTEMEEYAGTGEPMDKAGAYGIQGQASRFIHRVEGCYSNVVGLPVSLVWRRLREWDNAGA